MKTMAAGSFKAKCLAVMDEVQAKRETVVITKRGKPVAKLVPVNAETDEIYNFGPGRQGCRHGRCDCASDFRGGLGRAQVILVDTHVVVWLAFDQKQISTRARAAIGEARKNADRAGDLRYHLTGVGHTGEQGPHPAGRRPGIFLEGSRVPFCGAADQWQRLRPRNGTSRGLSQRSGRSHDRGYGAGGRGLCIALPPTVRSGAPE